MEPQYTLEEVTDPAAIARSQVLFEQAQRNSDWLQAHWADVLPQARGKFLAVAGQESFIADTSQAAWDWIASAHPEDKGALVQYVLPEGGPRIYGNYRGVVALR